MEIKEITYKNKIAIEEDPDYPEENQVTDENMNEIKEVVNYNGKKLKEVSEIELQTLQEENKKLKSALINVETEEAKSLHIEDASEVPAQLKVMGNQEQDGEPSPENEVEVKCLGSNKNLFSLNNKLENATISANGKISTLNGANLYYIEIKNNVEYILSMLLDSFAQGNVVYGFSDAIPVLNASATYNFTNISNLNNMIFTSNSRYLIIRFVVESQLNHISNIKLEQGKVVTSYSPYRTR